MSHKLNGRLNNAEKQLGIQEGADNIPILVCVVKGREDIAKLDAKFGSDQSAVIVGPKSEGNSVTAEEMLRGYELESSETNASERRRSGRRRR